MRVLGLDPDDDQARQWLEQELAKAQYNRPESFVRAALTWLGEQLDRLAAGLPASPALSTILLVVVLGVAAVVVLFAVRGTRRNQRLREPGQGSVLDEPGVSAAQYRARAQRALQLGDWDTAVLDAYRAIAASAQERTLIDEGPGLTAHEIATGLRDRFPGHAESLGRSADTFDVVRYGHRHVDADTARAVVELDRELSRTRPRHVVPTA